MIITANAYARAGLVGNPSDGYYGKTISFIIRNFAATVRLWESPYFEILPTPGDFARYESVAQFLKEQKLFGYYGGQRLMKAAVKTFFAYCDKNRLPLHDRQFTLQFDTTIPRLVGLSGSSGIVVATFRVLMEWYDVQIPRHLLPGLVLSAERDELGITAGLQDRVIQIYEGITYMNFDQKLMEQRGHGDYVTLNPPAAPPLYVAYDANRAEISDITHRNLRQLFDRGDRHVVEAMTTFGELAERGRSALMASDWQTLHEVTNANFDLRKTIMPISPENQRMIDVARGTGASAKFAGSGGAICGVYHSGKQYQDLVDALAALRCDVIRPVIHEAA